MTTTCYDPFLYTPTFLPMMPRPGTQALVVSRANKIAISALFASSLVRNNITLSLIGYTSTREIAVRNSDWLYRLFSHVKIECIDLFKWVLWNKIVVLCVINLIYEGTWNLFLRQLYWFLQLRSCFIKWYEKNQNIKTSRLFTSCR